jgi:hypothetical protein
VGKVLKLARISSGAFLPVQFIGTDLPLWIDSVTICQRFESARNALTIFGMESESMVVSQRALVIGERGLRGWDGFADILSTVRWLQSVD